MRFQNNSIKVSMLHYLYENIKIIPYLTDVNEKNYIVTDKISLNNLSSLALGWVFEEVKITSSTNAVVD